jgi:hypothetical protein
MVCTCGSSRSSSTASGTFPPAPAGRVAQGAQHEPRPARPAAACLAAPGAGAARTPVLKERSLRSWASLTMRASLTSLQGAQKAGFSGRRAASPRRPGRLACSPQGRQGEGAPGLAAGRRGRALLGCGASCRGSPGAPRTTPWAHQTSGLCTPAGRMCLQSAGVERQSAPVSARGAQRPCTPAGRGRGQLPRPRQRRTELPRPRQQRAAAGRRPLRRSRRGG